MNAAIIRRHHSGLPAHPNELDRWRIVRALTKREHYRYVSPKVTAVAGGYLVEPVLLRQYQCGGRPRRRRAAAPR